MFNPEKSTIIIFSMNKKNQRNPIFKFILLLKRHVIF
jgi:hypothetical protein